MSYNSLSDNEKKKLLYNMYIKEKKSFAQIAKELGSYPNKMRRDAIKFKIEIRNKSTAQKNAFDTGIVEHPTKGKKRSEKTKEKIGQSVMKSWESLSSTELQQRKLKAKDQWDNMDEDHKKNMLKLANEAVRGSSKTGSKLEKFILRGLIDNGYKTEFHKEQNLLNTKLQIDIFLPELNTAIEVDGPSHFLPVWGQESLARNVKYDNKKTGLLLGKGCVILRIRQTRDFSEARGRKILSQILSILSDIKNNYPEPSNRTIEIGD